MTETGRPVGSGVRDPMSSHFEVPEEESEGVADGPVADGDGLATALESGEKDELGDPVGDEDGS